jgi:hypothetical protein
LARPFAGAALAAMIVLLAMPGAGAAADLTGLDAARAVIGNTFHGEDDGGEFWDYYAPDGRFYSLQDGDLIRGSWTLEGKMLCMQLDSRICSEVEVSGDEAVMYDDDGEEYEGELLPGDYKGLK